MSEQKTSAGLLMYKFEKSKLKFLLVHPGGPFFKNKDEGFWGIPKGEIEESEDILETAKREFGEEVGIKPSGNFIPLESVKLKNGKIVHAWAFEGDFKGPLETKSFFEIEWPQKSGKIEKFQEIDKAEFFDKETANIKMNPVQFEFIEKLEKHLGIKNLSKII